MSYSPKPSRAKRLISSLSVSVLSLMTVSAHAFLVDNSQQKTIYIGKGNAQNMQAVTVQEIPPATTTIQQTRTYTNTNTAPNTYNQGYTNTQVTQSSVPAGTTTSQPFAIQPYGQQTNYGSSYQYGEQLPISTKSAAAIVFDLQTGQPIYQKNADAVRSIASVTKVMTAMVLMDAGLDMREEIVIEPSDFIAAKKASSNLRSATA